MVIAMVAVRMMEMSINEIVRVVSMRDGLMSATGAVDVTFIMA